MCLSLLFVSFCFVQMVNGETTGENFDKRPMGFRLWKASSESGLSHRFVALEGMEEVSSKE